MLTLMAGSQSMINLQRVLDTWNMAGGAIDALKVPDGLAGFREMVCQEAATIFTVKDAGKAPLMPLQGSQVQNLNYQQITRHGRLAFTILHTKWTTQIVHLWYAKWAHTW